MKINTKNTKNPNLKRYVLAAVFVVTLLGIVVAAYLYSRSITAEDTESASQTTTTPAKTSTTKPQTTTPQTTPSTSTGDLPSKDTPSNPPTVQPTINLTLSRAGQNTGSGQPLAIRTIVEGVTSGTCEVTLAKSGQATINKSYPITFEARTASCSGADVPASDFSADGDWQLSVIAKSGAQISNTVTSTVTITR